MPSLFDILEIGARSLFTHQKRIAVAGHNLANAATEGFSRQRADLVTTFPFSTPVGQFGTGVNISGIRRIRDDFLDRRIRTTTTELAYAGLMSNNYAQLETAFYDPLSQASQIGQVSRTGGISNSMDAFFSAAHEVSLQPEYPSVRTSFVEDAKTLAASFKAADTSMKQLRENVNDQIIQAVEEINSFIYNIADLNRRIMNVEVNARMDANDLRDQRDRILEQLAEKVQIQVTEQDFGVINVAVLGVNVVDGPNTIMFETIGAEDNLERYVEIRFVQEPSRILTNSFKTGELGALVELRDSIIPSYLKELDTLVYQFIQQVNLLHSGGSGLKSFQSLQSAASVSASIEPLVNAGLPFSMQAGTFTIQIVDSDRNVVQSYDITVDPTVDSLADIAARIDAADGVVGGGDLQASVTADNRLQIWTAAGQGFQFHGDNSGALAALGINTLFTGSTAEDIGINAIIDQDSDYLATSQSGAVGDNTIILSIAQLKDQRTMNSGTQTFTEFYRTIIGQIGIEGRRSGQIRNSSDLLLTALKEQRSSISGVSIDEELVNLIQAQQAFGAAARVVTMVDEMLDLITSRLGTGGR